MDTSTRGTRSRGVDGLRGGRGRATERGRGGGRGRARDAVAPRKPSANGSPNEAATTANAAISETWETPTDNTASAPEGWDQAAQSASTQEDSSWEVVTPAEAVPPAAIAEQTQTSSKPDGTRTWASMLKPAAKPKPVVPLQKRAAPPQQLPEVAPSISPPEQHPPAAEEQPTPPVIEEPQVTEPPAHPSPSLPPTEPALELTPSKDQLTESNLEQVEDISEPPATVTAASTAGTNDPRSVAGGGTPGLPMQHQTVIRPGLGGYQTTALKATSGRTSSMMRRVKEQQEAVVMPGNHAVDRAAVQFGSMGLGSGTEDLDVDDDREEPETRTQPPQHSPIAPKASLPPAPQQPTEILKAAPGLPLPSQPAPTSQPEQGTSQPTLHHGYSYNQFSNLHGSSTSQNPTESSYPLLKAYEPFGQPASQASTQAPNGFTAQSQASGQSNQLAQQSHLGGYSTAASDYASYYTTDHSRNTFPNAYAMYGQQPQASQETATAQQKPSSTFATSSAEYQSQTAQSHSGLPSQARFGPAEAQNSGHSTPNPPISQHGQAPGQQPHQLGQAHNQNHQHAGYPYGGNAYYSNYYPPSFVNQHAYGPERGPYDDVRRYEADQYMPQNHHFAGYAANQGRYGAGPYGGGKYGQPHQGYGMSPQSWDTHSTSPANLGGYGQQGHTQSARDNTSSLGSYGRTGSAQPSEGQQHTPSAFGGIPDPFGSRSQSSFTNQSTQQPGTQQGGSEEPSRGYPDNAKATGGPSPAPGQSTMRPTSATNVQGQTSQGQSQQPYAGYPQLGSQVHGQQSQYGSSLGGLSHQHPGQSHQSGYGAYGAFGGNYYGNNARGGW